MFIQCKWSVFGGCGVTKQVIVQPKFPDSEIDAINLLHTRSSWHQWLDCLCNPALMLKSRRGALAIQIVTYQSGDTVNGGADLGCNSCMEALDWGGVQLNKASYLLPRKGFDCNQRPEDSDTDHQRIRAAAQTPLKMCCEQKVEHPSGKSFNIDG